MEKIEKVFSWNLKRNDIPNKIEENGRTFYFFTASMVTPRLAEQRKLARERGIEWSDQCCTPGYYVSYSSARPVF